MKPVEQAVELTNKEVWLWISHELFDVNLFGVLKFYDYQDGENPPWFELQFDDETLCSFDAKAITNVAGNEIRIWLRPRIE